MIKIMVCCDFCEKEITIKEYTDQLLLCKSPIHEWNFNGHYVMCEKCALKIDYALAKFKNGVLEAKTQK